MSKKSHLLVTLWRSFAEYRWHILLQSALSSLGAVCEAATLGLLLPLLSLLSSGEKTYHKSLQVFGSADDTLGTLNITVTAPELFAALAGVVVMRAATQSLGAYWTTRTMAHYEHARRQSLFSAFLRATWSAQEGSKSGEIETVLTKNIYMARKLLNLTANAVVNAFNLIIMMVSAFVVDIRVLLMISAIAFALFFAVRPLSVYARRLGKVKAKADVDYAVHINQITALLREIKIFRSVEHFEKSADALAVHDSHLMGILTFCSKLVTILYQNAAFLIVLLGLGGLYVFEIGQVSALSVIILLLLRAMTFAQALQDNLHQMSESLPFLEKLDTYLGTYQKYGIPAGGKPLENVEEICFDRVGFTYPPALLLNQDDKNKKLADVPTHPEAQAVLHDVSFRIKRGETIGVIGPSGSGKSTLIQLLLRLRESTSGTFLVNQQDMQTYAHDAWMKQISYVPQEAVLLDETIFDNIAFHRNHVTKEQVIHAAKRAAIHDDILDKNMFADGYQTYVGDRGSSLSGGQRQRMCIARALADNPALLILDEPTSALDVHSEAKIQEALLQMKGSTTMIIVAHRLSTLSICDKILVLHEGRIQGFGHPAELAVENAYYRDALRLSGLVSHDEIPEANERAEMGAAQGRESV